MIPVKEKLKKLSEQFSSETYYLQLLDEFFPGENFSLGERDAEKLVNVAEKMPGLMTAIYKEAERRSDPRSRSQILEDSNIIVSEMLDKNSVNSMLDNSTKLIDNAEPSDDVLISNLNRLTQEPWQHPSENVDLNNDPDTSRETLSGDHFASLSINSGDEIELASLPPVRIQDLYKLPKIKKTSSDILEVCSYIFSLDIEVSRLNQAYSGHCAPARKQRSVLRDKYGAKFSSFTGNQDLVIRQRLNELVEAGVVTNIRDFCLKLKEECSGMEDETSHRSKWRGPGVRHILGLFVGQDIPQKPAYSCFERMMHLTFHDHDKNEANFRDTVETLEQIRLETGLRDQEDHRSNTPSVSPSLSLERESSLDYHSLSRSSSPANDSTSSSRSASPPHFVPVGPSSSTQAPTEDTSLPPSPDSVSTQRKMKSSTGRKRKLANTIDLNDGLMNPTTSAKLDDPAEVTQPVLTASDDNLAEQTEKERSNPVRKKRRTVKKYEKLCRLDTSDIDESNSYEDPDPDKFLKVIDPYQSQRSDSQNSIHLSNDRIVTIKDLYKIPKKSKTPGPIFAACVHILNKNVSVSSLNRACKEHTWIKNRTYREELRRKYGAKFRAHNDHQDSLILKRFAELKKANLIKDFNDFCSLLEKFTSRQELHRGKHSQKRNMRVRNIIGLYVGQDIPEKLAYYNYDRLLYLVLNRSNGVWRSRNYYEVDPAAMKNRSKARWTLEEDLELLQEVISAQVNIDNVADIETMHVDWYKLVEDQRFRGRSRQNIREHWEQRIYPALVEDLDIRELLHYRLNLVSKIIEQGATFRCEIDWDELAESFYPKTKSMLQKTFTSITRGGVFDLMRIDSAEEFEFRLKETSRRMTKMLHWSEELQDKHFNQERRESYMREMRCAAEKFLSDLARATHNQS